MTYGKVELRRADIRPSISRLHDHSLASNGSAGEGELIASATIRVVCVNSCKAVGGIGVDSPR